MHKLHSICTTGVIPIPCFLCSEGLVHETIVIVCLSLQVSHSIVSLYVFLYMCHTPLCSCMSFFTCVTLHCVTVCLSLHVSHSIVLLYVFLYMCHTPLCYCMSFFTCVLHSIVSLYIFTYVTLHCVFVGLSLHVLCVTLHYVAICIGINGCKNIRCY